jgi:benzoylformate decarboxylase
MPTVRDSFFEVLRQLKLTTIFGNPGSTEESFLQNLPPDFRYVLGLHEASVVAMADGYSQDTGEAVLVNLHTAAGIGNAMGNICTAWHNRTPMVILAGQQTRAMLLLEALLSNLQAVQLPKPYVKWSYETVRPEDAPAALLRAWACAVQPPAGPVFLSIPMDDFDAPAASLPPVRRVSRALHASADDLRETFEALMAARNPILITGGALDQGQDGGWDNAVRLAESLGCPVMAAPMEGRPGFPETHPQYQGVAPAAIGPLCEKLQGHDLALVVGAPVFRYYPYVAGDYLPQGMRLIQVSDDPQATARAPVGDSILADPARACKVLADLVAGLTAQSGRRPAPKEAPAAPRPAPGPSARISADSLFHALAGLRAEDSIIVQESLSNLKAMRSRLPTARPRSFFSASSGVLGYGLPAAVGVALAERDRGIGIGRKVICLLGDGAAQYTIQGLWNAAQLGLPILFIVLRNREYAILKSFAEMEETPEVPGLDLPGLDCVRLAEGYGCAAGRVDDPAALADALRDGLGRATPYLLEVLIDPEVPPLL